MSDAHNTKARPEILGGCTIQVPSPYGTVFVTLNENCDQIPFEIFLNVGKCGSDAAADAEALGRLCSLLLRIPSPLSEIKRIEMILSHLDGIGGSKEVGNGNGKTVRSIPDAVAAALRLYLEGRTGIPEAQ